MLGFRSEALSLLRRCITSKSALEITRASDPGKIRNYSAVEELEKPDNVAVIKKKKKQSKAVDEISEYFKSTDIDNHVLALPSTLVKRRKQIPDHLYLVDSDTADRIVELIRPDLGANSRKVIEVNAGTGVLTEKLLAAGIPVLTAMEPNVKCIQTLADLQAQYSKRLTIHEADLFSLWKIAYQDKQDGGNRVARLLSDFPIIGWGKEVGLKIIGATASVNFIKHVMMDVVRQCGIVSYGRPCLYLALPPSVWMRLSCDNTAKLSEYRSYTVLFQLLFDSKVLGQIPRKAFLPWTPSYIEAKGNKMSRADKMNKDHMYVVKIVGKRNLFTHIIDSKHIQPLWFFINHHMISRTGRVIPQMEAWQPGCGPSLIMKDLNIYTQFGDLNPPQMLELFKEFMTWDGYQNSFLPTMENSVQKMEQLLF